MKNMYKLLLVLFLIPLSIYASDKKGKITKTKTINKEFPVNKDATMHVINKYGNIDIVTWTENRIVMDITITTNGNDKEKVEKRLEDIDVVFDANSSNVSAKTVIKKIAKSWSLWGNKNKVNIEINYKIKLPVTNNVDLSMDYGGINLDKLEGRSKIDCDYGRLNIGELLNTDNDINVDYTGNSNIEFMKDGSINADYSTVHIEKTGVVRLNSDYSEISFGSLIDLEYNCDYGSLKIKDGGNLNGTSDYMNASIDKLSGASKINLSYGTLKIKGLDQDFKSLKIESNYAHNTIGVNSSNSFNVNANLSNSEFKYLDGFTFSKEIKNSSKKEYEGYYNNANSSKNITIISKYGGVTFKNN